MKQLTGLMLSAAMLIAACSGEQPANEVAQPAAGEEIAAAASPATAGSGAADPITALCLDMLKTVTPEACACGTKAFRASTENADVYAQMASHYLSETDAETPGADRWDQVVDAVLADTPGNKRDVSNDLGKAHREAVKSCEG